MINKHPPFKGLNIRIPIIIIPIKGRGFINQGSGLMAKRIEIWMYLLVARKQSKSLTGCTAVECCMLVLRDVCIPSENSRQTWSHTLARLP